VLEKINGQMSLGGRLTIISGMFAISTVFATTMFVKSSRSQITFTEKEQDGVHALTAIWDSIHSGALLEKTEHLDHFGKTQNTARYLRDKFQVGTALYDYAAAKNQAERFGEGRELILKVADGSNLTLDPDRDSYYIMDATVVRLPKLDHRIFELQEVLAQQQDAGSTNAYAVRLDRLNFAAEEAIASLTTSVESNKTGESDRAMSAEIQALQSKANTAMARARAAAEGRGDSAELKASLEALSDQVDTAWRASEGELDRLLDARLEQLQRKLILELGFIVLALAAAGFLSWSVSNGLSRRLQALLKTLDALTSGDKDLDIPCLKDTNETGKIGRTLEQFKSSLIENEAAERRSAEEKVRAEAARRQSEEEAQTRAQELVVEAFGDGMGALANGHFAYRIVRELPEAYLKLRDDFHTALQNLEVATKAAEQAARQREEDQRTAETARIASQAEAIAAAERLVVGSFGEGMSALANGDLTYRVTKDVPAAYVPLRDDFNGAVTAMQDAMAAIMHNATAVKSGAGEIAQAANDLSRRTEQQAATLEQTAAALDEVTVTVRKTAEGAALANKVVGNARQDASKSGEVVTEAVAAMSEIERSSRQVSQIIGVIDEIAFQTNLLALNAGVEAARAGDAGRGFAVVAQEVRALAQRSSAAAKEIKALIFDSSKHVGNGVQLVNQAGASLSKIVDQVNEMSALVSEISASAGQQSTALGEVNTAVNQLDQVTQQNAAMVEETTAASQSLNNEAQELGRQVARFRVEYGAADLGSAPAPAARRDKAPLTVKAAQKCVAAFSGQRQTATALKRFQSEDDWKSF